MDNIINYKKGQIISNSGDFELWMYEIRSGKVAVYADYGTSEQRIQEIITAPNIVGEIGMFLSRPRVGTFVALEDVEAIKIEYDHVEQYFSDKPSKVIEMMQYMCEKMARTTEMFGDACHAMAEYIRDDQKEKSPSLLARINNFLGIDRKYNKKK